MPQVTRGVAVTAVIGVIALFGVSQGLAGEDGATGPTGATGPQGIQGVAGLDATEECQNCHDDTALVSAKQRQLSFSAHGIGEVWEEEAGANNCVSCHAGTGFVAWTAAGGPTSATKADPNSTPIDCRTCHLVHTTYTDEDFKLRTTAPVKLQIDAAKIYDAGSSNLCANCHQSRTAAPKPGGGTNKFTSTHYGPHHGPQATMLMSLNGYGVTDDPSPHYTQTEGGCVTCHMADDAVAHAGGHTFNATLKGCTSCHEGLTTFDRHGVQTTVKGLLAQLEDLLTKQGVMHDGHPVTGKTFSENQVGAYWNWVYVTEDGSLGVHNSYYAEELLRKSIKDLS